MEWNGVAAVRGGILPCDALEGGYGYGYGYRELN